MDRRRLKIVAAACWVAAWIAACGPAVKKPEAPVFYPPSPALPRIQYLTSYTGVDDIQQQSAFNRFVAGAQQNRQVNKPYGVAIYDGKIYVCDTNATVTVFDLKARQFGFLKGAIGQGVLKQPVNISITQDGTKYVADPIRGQVVEYDRSDEYVRAFGSPSEVRPLGALRFENRLYVADAMHSRVVAYDVNTSSVVRTFGDKGDPSERLDRPTNLAFDRDGYLYVTDAGRFQIVKFDRDGHFRGTIGKLGDNLGHFARPKGIAIDRQGIVYAVDAAFNNVQMFNTDGRLLMSFGEGGNKRGSFLLPAQVALDYDNIDYFRAFAQPGFTIEYLILVTSQFGDRRVNVLAYGHEEGKRYPSDEQLLQEIQERREKEQEKQ